MSLAAGTSRTQPFVSILCEVPIRAVNRTALYNEGMRWKREDAARGQREKKDWGEEKREGEAQGLLKIVLRPASYRKHLANDREKNCYAPTKL